MCTWLALLSVTLTIAFGHLDASKLDLHEEYAGGGDEFPIPEPEPEPAPTKCPFSTEYHQEPHMFSRQQMKVQPPIKFKFKKSPFHIKTNEAKRVMKSFEENQELEHREQERDLTEQGFEMVNYRITMGDPVKSAKLGDQEQIDQRNNWWSLKNVISYFPSGQQQLKRRQQRPVGGFDGKSDSHGDTSSVKSEQQIPTTPEIPQVSKIMSSKGILSDSIVESPIISIVSSKTEDGTELEQQERMQSRDPISMYADDQTLKAQQPIENRNDQWQISQPESASRGLDISQETTKSPSDRVRESLLQTAKAARNLGWTGANSSGPSGPIGDARDGSSQSEPDLTVSTNSDLGSDISARSAPTLGLSTNPRQPEPTFDESAQHRPAVSSNVSLQERQWSDETALSPKVPVFLGFGQLQRNEPFNGNGRTQARLSCQFGEPAARNMSISVGQRSYLNFKLNWIHPFSSNTPLFRFLCFRRTLNGPDSWATMTQSSQCPRLSANDEPAG